MSGSTFGKLFTVTNFGESHGPAIGCVIDGCPPGIAIAPEDFAHDLARRATGKSRHTSQRHEADAVEIVSGVYEGKTTGTPWRSASHCLAMTAAATRIVVSRALLRPPPRGSRRPYFCQ